MKVSRYNYAAQFPDGLESVMADLRHLILKGRYILTAEVVVFEMAFAELTETRFARGVNTGTDALAVTLASLGVGLGDEVITQANTFNATINGILLAGARPVLVDANPQTFLIDATQLESAITPRTKVIVPVHLYGKPTPMDSILRLARKRGLMVVEDAAQAHGAKIDGKPVGSFGIAGCFSFHPSKNLAAAGDGGAVVTNDESLAQVIDEVRSLGQRGPNEHVRPGFNSKLDSIQARILSAKLPHLDRWNAERRRVAAAYRERMEDLPLGFQMESPNEDHVYHLFQVRTPLRDGLLQHLKVAGVDAVVRYPQAIHLQPAFAQYGWQRGQFPVAETLSQELLCLPIRPDLTEAEIDYVSEQVCDFLSRNHQA